MSAAIRPLTTQPSRSRWDPVSAAPSGSCVTDVHLHSSGIHIFSSRFVTVDRVALANPKCHNDGGNGYLFMVMYSNDILFRDSTGRRGRHNFVTTNKFGNVNVVFQRVTSLGGYYSDSLGLMSQLAK